MNVCVLSYQGVVICYSNHRKWMHQDSKGMLVVESLMMCCPNSGVPH